MKRRGTLLMAALWMGVSLPARAPVKPPGKDRLNVERLLRTLAHDSMEGRGTATLGEERASRFIAEVMKQVGLKPMGDDGYFQRVPMAMLVDSDRLGRNVVGMIPGSDRKLKTEVILVMAHHDHLGIRGPGINGDSIYNGADDDASGVVAVLEIARALRQGKGPKRTIIFATMTGEEMGLLGTRYFITNPPVPLATVVAGFEIEMIGRPDSLAGGFGKAWLTGYDRSTMGDMLKANGIPIVADPRPDQNFFQRSDNFAFAQLGIVAHTLSTFNLHTDYHRPSDDVDKVDFDHMTAVIKAAAAAVEHLANGPTPAWHQGGRPTPPAARTAMP